MSQWNSPPAADDPAAVAAAAAVAASNNNLPTVANANGAMDEDDLDEHGDMDELGNDAEGVWSPDIEQSFQEALAIYPPCGRRKIILSDEGKMYGRNELIARYIKLRTGKTRTRKQVSSHIQVLARRKAKDIQAQIKDQSSKEKAMQALSSMSSSQIVSATALQNPKGAALPPAPTGHNPAGPQYPPYNSQDVGAKEKVLQSMAAMSSAQIVSASAMHNKAAMGISPYHYAPSQDQSSRDRALQSMASMSSAQIVSASAMHNKSVASRLATGGLSPSGQSPQSTAFWPSGGMNQDVKPPYGFGMDKVGGSVSEPVWQGRSIAGSKLRLVEFSAYLEQNAEPESYHKHFFVHIGTNPTAADPLLEAVDIRQIYDKFPEKKGGLKELYDKGPASAFFLVKFWADLNTSVEDEQGAFYGVNSHYESAENMTIQSSTKVCSFGKQVVEKVETEFGRFENGRYHYHINRSPMCEYMINFIHKLKQLPEKHMMNSVLENFTVLQVVTTRDSQETLLCIAYVFEVSTSVHGTQHHIYRLVKD